MIVGSTSVSVTDVMLHSQSAESLMEFAASLIPEEFAEVEEIQHNQRYLCCMLLRKSTVNWDHKKAVIEEVLRVTKVTGYVDIIIAARDLYDFADTKKLTEYRRL